MKNVKFVSVFAACGFILSFVFGLFSHTSILSVLLKALIFGIIFGVLGFVINIVFEKFLADESTEEMDIDIPVQKAASSNSDSKGKFVDITIRDEDLPLSTSENHFVVGDNHQMLNDTDYGHEVPASHVPQNTDTDANVSFKPVQSLETLTNVSTKESIHPDSIPVREAPAPVSNVDNISDKGIDTLPDMTDFTVDKMTSVSDGASGDDEDYDTDSGNDFETTAIRSTKSEAEVPEIKDASLYAKAISSILSSEDN